MPPVQSFALPPGNFPRLPPWQFSYMTPFDSLCIFYVYVHSS